MEINKKKILAALVILIGLAGFGVFSVRLYEKKQAALAAVESRNAEEENRKAEADGTDELEEDLWLTETDESGAITYDGKRYRRNTAVRAILLIGVDTSGQMEQSQIVGTAGQADGIFLAAQDMTRDTLRILMIPRDTMTYITLYDLSGNSLGKDRQHLTLAFAYGDGREKSCKMVEEGVSDLLGGLKIDGYMAVNTSMISVLNDEIGGVKVTIPMEGLEAADPELEKGKTVVLKGKQAERFVRYRNTKESQTAITRMGQQKLYIEGFFEKAKEEAARDQDLIVRLVEDVEGNMVTNMAKDQYMDMGLAALNSSQSLGDGDILMLPGKGVETQLFDEYHPDMEGLRPMVLDLFYKELR